MSAERTRRAGRLAGLRLRAAEVAEAELARLTQRRIAAVEARDRAEEAWSKAAEAPAQATYSSADLGAVHAHLIGLRRRVDVLAQQVAAAKNAEEAGRRRVVVARMEHKKIEAWHDGLEEGTRVRALSDERKVNDEVGARIARSR